MNRYGCILTLLILIAGTAVAAAEPSPPFGIRPYTGEQAPPVRLQDMDGHTVDLHAMRGRWVFVHFWASWCGPCRKEMPAIEKLAQRISPDALPIVMINVAEDEDTLFSFLAEVSPSLISYMDRDGQVAEVWQPRGLPATYLVDPAGRIRYQALGGRAWDQPVYLDFLEKMLEAPAQ